jgi:hypothetical protein
LTVSVAAQRKPLLTKVEHFYLVSDDAERLFQFFKDEFQLAEVWPFRRYGGFASGGLSLGNVVMEFVTEKAVDGAAAQAEFKGIAFEPAGDAEAVIAELQRRRIAHGEPSPYTFTQDGQQRVGWVTISLPGVSTASAEVFICDYKQRERVAAGRRSASSELAESGGGPLGVTSLREIVLGVKSVKKAAREWGKLIGPAARKATAVFAFGSGPRIRLVRAEVEGIQHVVVGVKSAARAKQYLTDRKMIARAKRGQLWITAATIGGLMIRLVED